jgi:hypothetical protein
MHLGNRRRNVCGALDGNATGTEPVLLIAEIPSATLRATTRLQELAVDFPDQSQLSRIAGFPRM